MAFTTDDFNKIWASTSPLTPYEFSESQYKDGWNFIGGTPPSRQMWDFLQKNNDEKMQYLANNYLPLSGGTMTGNLTLRGTREIMNATNTDSTFLDGGKYVGGGSNVALYGKDHSSRPGYFFINARKTDGTGVSIEGRPDGTLTWNGKSIPQRSYGITLGANATHTFDIAENGAVIFAKRGNNASCHMVTVWDSTSTQFFVSGTDPITVSASVGAKTATITNVNASSVAVKIINGGAL